MRNLPRKAVVKHLPTLRHQSLAGLYRNLANKGHKHVCSNPSCRLIYDDACFSPEHNARCRPCKGQRRTWIYEDGLSAWDPRPCCLDNTAQVTDPDVLERFSLAGPGPWFQCQSCKRAHGHPCIDPDLLNRPLAVNNPEGTP